MLLKSRLCVLFVLVTVVFSEEYYDKKYDYFDIDYFVNSPRLLRKYLECFLDRAPCTPIGRVFKNVLQEVIITGCAKCTPLQRRFTKKSFDAFKSQLPESHAELRRKYDPDGKYFDQFERAIADA